MSIYTYKYCWEDPENPKGWDSATYKSETEYTEKMAVEALESRFPGKLFFVRFVSKQGVETPAQTIKGSPEVKDKAIAAMKRKLGK